MKRILAIIISVLTLVCGTAMFTACGNDENVLKIGVTNYKPMDYKEEGSDEWIGFDADLAKEVGKILDKKIEFVEINWDNKVMSVNAKEIDIIWNGMTITDELKEALLISEPYLDNCQVVVCRKSELEKYKTAEDIKNATTILAEGGSAGEEAAKGVLGESSNKFKTAEKQLDCLLEVKSDANTICIIDKNMAKALINDKTSYSDLAYAEVGFPDEQFGLGFRKGDTTLKNDVENAIKTLKENGKYDELFNKYFG